MGRAPCCGDHQGLTRGPWTAEEDQKLIHYVERHGLGNWRTLAKLAGLSRCGKSCRLRWKNYLRPDIKRGTFSLQEDLTIIRLHAILGNKWSAIASHLDGRTDNEIKHYWNTKLKKRLLLMGIDPVTHRSLPTPDHMLSPFIASSSSTVDLAALTAMAASWNISALIEAELNRLATELSQNEKPLGTLKNPVVLPVSWPVHPTGADSTSSDETSLLLPSETSMDQLLRPQNQITQGFVPEQKDPIKLYNTFSQDSSSDVQEIRKSELGNGHMRAEERLLAVDTEITGANEPSSGRSTSSNLDKGGSRILENTIPYQAEIGNGAESMWQAAGVTDNEDESNSWLNLLDFMENSMS